MASRNNKKRGVDAAKKQDFALFFRCLGLRKWSSRVDVVTICGNDSKKEGLV